MDTIQISLAKFKLNARWLDDLDGCVLITARGQTVGMICGAIDLVAIASRIRSAIAAMDSGDVQQARCEIDALAQMLGVE